MQTIEIPAQDMQSRIARFAELRPLPVQSNPNIPQAADDLIWAREILPVIGAAGGKSTPMSVQAPIQGAGDIRLAFTVCPPGQGPTLHAHGGTFETFTVLEGRFEVSWNDNGADSAVLERFDTISVPPGVCRAFRNVGESDGILQVIASGDMSNPNDVDYPESTAAEIEAIGPGILDEFKRTGLTFTAGKDD